MPIYAFECTACAHRFERLQKLSDPDPTTCPECQQAEVRRQLTAPAFRLAGSGWYETDFKRDGEKKRNLAGDGSDAGASASGAGADGKSERPPTDASAKPADRSANTSADKSADKPAGKPAAATGSSTPAPGAGSAAGV